MYTLKILTLTQSRHILLYSHFLKVSVSSITRDLRLPLRLGCILSLSLLVWIRDTVLKTFGLSFFGQTFCRSSSFIIL